MTYLIAVAVVVAVSIVSCLVVARCQRVRALMRQHARERALERDALRLASAKLKFRNLLAKQGHQPTRDPLTDLYGVEVPTDCRMS